MAQGRGLLPNQRARFLEVLAQTANVTASSEAIQRSTRSMYELRDRDEQFAADWADALEKATDTLEQAARNRAIEGVVRYVTCKDGLIYDNEGKPVTERAYSDSLTALLLKAHRRDKFGDRSTVDMNVNTDVAALIEEGRKRARGE